MKRPYSSVAEHFIRNEKVRGSIPRAGYFLLEMLPTTDDTSLSRGNNL